MADPSTPTPTTSPAEPAKQLNGAKIIDVTRTVDATATKPAQGSVDTTKPAGDAPKLSVASTPSSEPATPQATSADAGPPPRPVKGSSTKAVVLTVGAAVGLAALFASLAGPAGDRPSLFASTEDLRSQLTTASAELTTLREAKATAERALAETRATLAAEQTKRAAAEKTVADIRAILGVTAPAGDAAPPAAAAKGDAAKAPAATAPTPATPAAR